MSREGHDSNIMEARVVSREWTWSAEEPVREVLRASAPHEVISKKGAKRERSHSSHQTWPSIRPRRREILGKGAGNTGWFRTMQWRVAACMRHFCYWVEYKRFETEGSRRKQNESRERG